MAGPLLYLCDCTGLLGFPVCQGRIFPYSQVIKSIGGAKIVDELQGDNG
jgi:hypothetical protein